MFEGLDAWDRGRAVYLLALLLFILLSSAVVRRHGVGRTLSMLLVWLVVIGVVAFAANRREDLLGLLGERDPVVAVVQGDGVQITARDDGHFWVRAAVNGEPVLFLIDTGASDIVLSQSAAERIGVDTSGLRYDRAAMTANGMVRGAQVNLRTIEIGGIVRSNIPATVTEGPLATNLLGMRYMRTLKGWRVEGPTLTLHP